MRCIACQRRPVTSSLAKIRNVVTRDEGSVCCLLFRCDSRCCIPRGTGFSYEDLEGVHDPCTNKWSEDHLYKSCIAFSLDLFRIGIQIRVENRIRIKIREGSMISPVTHESREKTDQGQVRRFFSEYSRTRSYNDRVLGLVSVLLQFTQSFNIESIIKRPALATRLPQELISHPQADFSKPETHASMPSPTQRNSSAQKAKERASTAFSWPLGTGLGSMGSWVEQN
jgi:hypothetical protein